MLLLFDLELDFPHRGRFPLSLVGTHRLESFNLYCDFGLLVNHRIWQDQHILFYLARY